MAIYGTSYFVSREHAIKYYQPYGCAPSDVDRKLSEGEIHIGLPPRKPGERLKRIDEGCRYAIVEPQPTSLYDELVAHGHTLDHHESDLYVLDTPSAREIIARHECTFTPFRSNGELWLDVPFMFDPWWRARA